MGHRPWPLLSRVTSDALWLCSASPRPLPSAVLALSLAHSLALSLARSLSRARVLSLSLSTHNNSSFFSLFFATCFPGAFGLGRMPAPSNDAVQADNGGPILQTIPGNSDAIGASNYPLRGGKHNAYEGGGAIDRLDLGRASRQGGGGGWAGGALGQPRPGPVLGPDARR